MSKADWAAEVKAAIERSGSANDCGVEIRDDGKIVYFDFYPHLRTERRISWAELKLNYLHGSEIRRLNSLRGGAHV